MKSRGEVVQVVALVEPLPANPDKTQFAALFAVREGDIVRLEAGGTVYRLSREAFRLLTDI